MSTLPLTARFFFTMFLPSNENGHGTHGFLTGSMTLPIPSRSGSQQSLEIYTAGEAGGRRCCGFPIIGRLEPQLNPCNMLYCTNLQLTWSLKDCPKLAHRSLSPDCSPAPHGWDALDCSFGADRQQGWAPTNKTILDHLESICCTVALWYRPKAQGFSPELGFVKFPVGLWAIHWHYPSGRGLAHESLTVVRFPELPRWTCFSAWIFTSKAGAFVLYDEHLEKMLPGWIYHDISGYWWHWQTLTILGNRHRASYVRRIEIHAHISYDMCCLYFAIWSMIAWNWKTDKEKKSCIAGCVLFNIQSFELAWLGMTGPPQSSSLSAASSQHTMPRLAMIR